jgi:hypothetical protein
MAINEGDGEADKGPVGPEDIASTPAQTSFWTTQRHENKGGEMLIRRTDGNMRDQINMEQISFLPDQRRSKSEEEARHEKQILQWVDFARQEERRECEYRRAKNHGICHDSWAMGGILEKGHCGVGKPIQLPFLGYEEHSLSAAQIIDRVSCPCYDSAEFFLFLSLQRQKIILPTLGLNRSDGAVAV